MKLSHALWGHPRRVGHGGEIWQNVVHWRREWQTTSVFLPWEPREQYEKISVKEMQIKTTAKYCNTLIRIIQFSSVAQSCLTLCDPMDYSTPGLAVHHQLLEFTQTHVHWVRDAIQPSHALSSPSPPAFNLSQHQGLSRWVSSSHQMAKVLEFQLQHQSFQWTPRTDLP